MKNLSFLLLLGTCLTLFACSKNNDTETIAELGQIFQLKIAETAIFTTPALSVEANRVIQDNRCPANVQCITAGQVVVLFNFTVAGTKYPVEVTLDPSKPQDAEVEVEGYTIRLVTVNPYPQDTNNIELEDYSFSLVVEQ